MSVPFPECLDKYIDIQNNLLKVTPDTIDALVTDLKTLSDTDVCTMLFSSMRARPRNIIHYFQIAKILDNPKFRIEIDNYQHIRVWMKAAYRARYFDLNWPEEKTDPDISSIVKDDVNELARLAALPDFRFDKTVSIEEFGFDHVPDSIPLLSFAALMGSIKCFKFILINGSNPKIASTSTKSIYPHKPERTALYYAVANGDQEIIQLCIEANLALSEALFASIDFFNFEVLQWLIEVRNLDVDTVEDSITPLINAIYRDNIEAVRFLLSKGCSILTTDANRWTPAFEVVTHGNVAMIEYFLQLGLKPDLTFQTKPVLAYCLEFAYFDAIVVLEKAGWPMEGLDANKLKAFYQLFTFQKRQDQADIVARMLKKLNVKIPEMPYVS